MPLKEGSQELNSDISKPIQRVVKILPKFEYCIYAAMVALYFCANFRDDGN